MNITRKRNKTIDSALGSVAVATVAAPALLFLGAGTAAAQPNIDPNSALAIDSPPGGVTVHVRDDQQIWYNKPAVLSCVYSSKDQNGPGFYQSLPFDFEKGDGGNVTIWPAVPTGHFWSTNVQCFNPANPGQLEFNYNGPTVRF